MDCDILQQDIQTLLEYFAKNLYRARDSESVRFSFYYSLYFLPLFVDKHLLETQKPNGHQ
jgi:hypothetical protein